MRRPPSEIRKAAIAEGMTTLRQAGLEKVFKGETTLRDIASSISKCNTWGYKGLNIGSRCFASVGLSTGNGRYLVRDYKVITLPDGLIKPSPIDLNIKDPGRLEEIIKQFLLNSKTRMKKKIFLGIPDVSVKVSIVDLEKLPSEKNDLEKILAWKMEKVSLFPLQDVKLSFQVLDEPTKRDGGSYRLLVSMIKRDILIQYEDLISSLGL